MMKTRFVAIALAGALATPAAAQQAQCAEGVCRVSLTAVQLLAQAESLVAEHRFGEAAPMIAALENAPELKMQRQFLLGYASVESGDLDGGIKSFRSILENHPEQTRVRLELARALMLKGKAGAADHHFRLAQDDEAIPAEIAATIRSSRRLLADKQQWAFNLDLGFAPDSNITNGTNAETIDIAFGNQLVPLTLDDQAREKSGVGQTLGFSGTARIGIGEETKLLIEADSQIVNYGGKQSDDIVAQIAIGPQFALSDSTRISIQALGSQRWYGGQSTQIAGGVRTNLHHALGDSDRIGLSIDARRSDSAITNDYSGWQLGGTATYEHVVARTMIASASLFARRDALNAKEYGVNLGIGGELPFGLTAGVSGGVSRANYDAPLLIFSADPRREWRLNGRAQLGLRALRLLGFSPSVTYSFSQTQSSLTLFDTTRHRVRFGLARYF
jgi:outer membrane protein